MAKEEMICPFSGKLCRECALYRGRHYYLCFSKKYRGHLKKSGGVTKVSISPTSRKSPGKQFEMPPIRHTGAIDPFTTILRDIE